MNIHFSNVNFNSSSGPNSFGFRLAKEMSARGHNIVGKDQDYDVFLCFIEPSSLPKKESKFILRLDGIWFKPEEFVTHNRNIKWAYDNCDHVVWQSNFDKEMTQKWWGQKQGSVIHNGIEKTKIENLNSDLKELRKKFDRIFVCSANWHRQKRLKENIDFFLKNRKEKDGLFVLGSNPDYIVSDESILYFGSISHEMCLQIYSVSDWFLHLAWLDHCPNVVVEALSQGCPVICTDSGGTKEIVKDNGLIIKEKNIYNFELTDYDKPYTLNVEKINFPKIIVKNDYLDIKYICDKYEELF